MYTASKNVRLSHEFKLRLHDRTSPLPTTIHFLEIMSDPIASVILPKSKILPAIRYFTDRKTSTSITTQHLDPLDQVTHNSLRPVKMAISYTRGRGGDESRFQKR